MQKIIKMEILNTLKELLLSQPIHRRSQETVDFNNNDENNNVNSRYFITTELLSYKIIIN